ncbi:hypothetical protein ASD30_16995 [Nocardioides sp. Root140]|nr:hypothetical protein ASD30_16995 [Nocardioides sp. Root140]
MFFSWRGSRMRASQMRAVDAGDEKRRVFRIGKRGVMDLPALSITESLRMCSAPSPRQLYDLTAGSPRLTNSRLPAAQ